MPQVVKSWNQFHMRTVVCMVVSLFFFNFHRSLVRGFKNIVKRVVCATRLEHPILDTTWFGYLCSSPRSLGRNRSICADSIRTQSLILWVASSFTARIVRSFPARVNMVMFGSNHTRICSRRSPFQEMFTRAERRKASKIIKVHFSDFSETEDVKKRRSIVR